MADRFLPPDDDARDLARHLLEGARHAALAVIQTDGQPLATRIAFGLDPSGQPMTLVSDLSAHTGALRATPRASILVGEPGDAADPLTRPRLSLQVTAEFVPATDPDRAGLKSAWLARHPKAALYADFADFHFVRLRPGTALLNAGFGRAYRLAPRDVMG